MKVLKKMFVLLIIFILFCGKNIMAYNDGGGGSGGWGGGGGGWDGEIGNEPPCIPSYSCVLTDPDGFGLDGYTNENDPNTGGEVIQINWNFYDVNNKIIGNTNKKSSSKILAGTSIGLSLYEKHTIRFYVTGKAESSCGGYEVKNFCFADQYKAAVKKYIENDDANLYKPSYKVSGVDPNNADCNNDSKVINADCNSDLGASSYIYKDTLYNNGMTCPDYDKELNLCTNRNNCKQDNKRFPATNKCFQITRYFYFQKSGSCMNVKTGKVRYIDNIDENDNNLCNDDEIYVSNGESDDGVPIWNIFTPLNSSEKDGFNVKIKRNEKISKDLCIGAINASVKNNDGMKYKEFIRYGNGENLMKLPNNTTPEEDKDIIREAGGCYHEEFMKINIVQKFYNETKDGNIKGFKIYYRQINVNNPFPNGIARDSYWKEWEQDKDDLVLNNSFNSVWYTQKGGINFASDNYSDWKKMNIDGSSPFVSENYINRKGDSYYALGCGKLNQNEYLDEEKKQKNYLYKEECLRFKK